MMLWLTVTMRIGLSLVALLAVRLQPPTFESGNWLNLLLHGTSLWSQILSSWQRWDALWYQQISMHGYRAGNDTAAFYPLYPLLSRAVSLPLMGNIVPAELIVSTIAFGIAGWLLYTLARMELGPLPARLAVLLLVFFPTAFFLLAPYTEGLFLCLTMGAFLFARRDQPWLAGLSGLGAGLTHIEGAFLVLPLAYLYLGNRSANGRGLGLGLVAALLPPLGPIAFTLYQHLVVGEFHTGLAAQGAWAYHLYPPWRVIADSAAFVAHTADPIEFLNLACVLGFTVLAAAATLRLPLAYALYVWPYLLLLYTREMGAMSPLMSDCRFVLALFPCFIVLALWLARRPWLAVGWLVLGLLLQAFLLNYFEHWGFVA